MKKDFENIKKAQEQMNQLALGQQGALARITENHELEIGNIKDKLIVNLQKQINENKKTFSDFSVTLAKYKLDLSEYELLLNENKALIEKQDFTIDLQDKRILNLNIDLRKITNRTNIISLVAPVAYKEIQNEGKAHIIGRLGGDNDDRSKLLYGKYVRTMWNYVSNEVGVNSTKMIKVEDVDTAKSKIQQWKPIRKYKDKLLRDLAKNSDLKQRGKELTPKEEKEVILYDRLQAKYGGDLIKYI